MSRESLKTKYTTEYQKAIIERYADDIPETENGPEDYEKIADFYFRSTRTIWKRIWNAYIFQ